MKKKKKIYVSSLLITFFSLAIALNYHSLHSAKNACIENNMTPDVDQSFLAINWTVSCE
ncbi:hypothetical protein JOC85_001047 [Bacillus mesophilus]|uniref:Secreted protein n=1 Tax=Bacillus mesophilus TaxID=1808955 RepID=A0A6M0Q458_9BACI|nr:hypothetical protein [Bacillus mesophilus]MBM7660280.1 hypothetical protein [Bacillus mesophilus]NEY70994.1 hypothetical protein [Bacillus mesophilus]